MCVIDESVVIYISIQISLALVLESTDMIMSEVLSLIIPSK